MPRGYLKRQSKVVGRKAARGGGSGPVGVPKHFYCRPWKKTKPVVFVDDLEDLDSFYDYEENDSYDDNWTIEQSKESLQPVNDVDSCFDEGAENHQDGNHRLEDDGFVDIRDSEVGANSSFLHSNMDSTSFSMVDVASAASTGSAWDFVLGDTLAREPRHSTNEKDYVEVSFVQETGSASGISLLLDPEQADIQKDLFFSRTCYICLQEKPKRTMMRLMNKCNHPLACYDCLRTHYVDFQMKDLSNYPLQCCWPGCERVLRDVQMRRLTNKWQEMELFYRNQILAKERRKELESKAWERQKEQNRFTAAQRRRVVNFQALQYCSACSAPNRVFPSRRDDFHCQNCHQPALVDVISRDEVLDIVEALGDDMVNCPSCFVLIAKDGGCSHMNCSVCRTDFNFEEAQKRQGYR